MGKASKRKKERRGNRKWAAALEKAADLSERDGKALTEFTTALRSVAELGKKLGTINGLKQIRGQNTRSKD